MLKTRAILEVKKGENVYELHLPSDAPLGEVHDVLYSMRSFVLDLIQKNLAVDQPKAEEPKESS